MLLTCFLWFITILMKGIITTNYYRSSPQIKLLQFDSIETLQKLHYFAFLLCFYNFHRYSLAQQKSCTAKGRITSTTTSKAVISGTATMSTKFASNSDSNISGGDLAPTIPFSLGGAGNGGSGDFFSETLRKETLLRQMWNRELQEQQQSNQQLKYAGSTGSWSPPMVRRRVNTQNRRLNKVCTLPEFSLQSACIECRKLGVHSADNSFDCDKPVDFVALGKSVGEAFSRHSTFGSSITTVKSISHSSSVSTIIDNEPFKNNKSIVKADLKKTLSDKSNSEEKAVKRKSSVNSDSSIKDISRKNSLNDISRKSSLTEISRSVAVQESASDENGNNVLNYDTVTITSSIPDIPDISERPTSPSEDPNTDRNNNNNSGMTSTDDQTLKKADSIDSQDNTITYGDDMAHIDRRAYNYHILQEENVCDNEIDHFISKLLIDNLNNVIQTVNENLQSNGENNLVRIIDYQYSQVKDGGVAGEGASPKLTNSVGKLNQHATNQNNQLAKNSRNWANQHKTSKENPLTPSVSRNSSRRPDAHSSTTYRLFDEQQKERQKNYFSCYGTERGRASAFSNYSFGSQEENEFGALVNTGSCYPEPAEGEGHAFIPRMSAIPRTESMEVNQPSSASAYEEDIDEFNSDSDISLVDSLDSIRITQMHKQQSQKRKMNAFYHRRVPQPPRPIPRQVPYDKAQAFFVPIVDSDQQIDEHIVVAELMPERLKEKLIMRERRRDAKKLSDQKIKQWRMQRFIERKMEEVNVNQAAFDTGNNAFKVMGISGPPQTNIVRTQYSGQTERFAEGTGWTPKARVPPNAIPSRLTSKKKNLRNNIGKLESYKIDSKGKMQIQLPAKVQSASAPPVAKPVQHSPSTVAPSPVQTIKKTIITTSLNDPRPAPEKIAKKAAGPVKAPVTLKKKPLIENTQGNSFERKMDARRKQILKDVQQMTIYTPEESDHAGPRRVYTKTEIKEGDKNVIEILEIVECDAHPPSSSSPQSPYHKFHTSSTGYLGQPPTIVNNSFNFHCSKNLNTNHNHTATNKQQFDQHSKIPVYRAPRVNRFGPRDSSPHMKYSSSSTGDSPLEVATSKVDRMIADLLIEALRTPELSSPRGRSKSRFASHPSILGAESSSSTGYGTGGESSSNSITSLRRTANNSAGAKYLQRFEVIPEEKSSFSVDSSPEDNMHDESDWKLKKNLENNDIKKSQSNDSAYKEEENSSADASQNENSFNNSSNSSHNHNHSALPNDQIESPSPNAFSNIPFTSTPDAAPKSPRKPLKVVQKPVVPASPVSKVKAAEKVKQSPPMLPKKSINVKSKNTGFKATKSLFSKVMSKVKTPTETPKMTPSKRSSSAAKNELENDETAPKWAGFFKQQDQSSLDDYDTTTNDEDERIQVLQTHNEDLMNDENEEANSIYSSSKNSSSGREPGISMIIDD